MQIRMKTILKHALSTCVAALSIAALASAQNARTLHPYYLHNVPNGFIHFAADAQPAAAGLPTWAGNFTYGGRTYTYTMVGADPATGTSTTIPVTFIPIIFKIGTVTFDPTQNVNQFPANEITLLEQSPIFTPYPLSAGPTNLGNSQYIDAFMRANFWGSAQSSGYHLMLGQPAVKHAITLTVPAMYGETIAINNPPYNSTIGNVNINYFQYAINKILASTKLGLNPSNFILFVYYNVFFYQGTPSNCCILGFHSQDGSFTDGTAAFNDPGEFTGSPIEDIEVITHEIGEAIDDPTGGNAVPAWGNVGQVAGCQSNLEVGDPVTGVITTIPGTNGFTYHPEDLVFVNWFSRTSPSPSVNGWYTFLNTFTGYAKACPPGGSN
jgi:hypothetical protein